jgi:hypothetical protein
MVRVLIDLGDINISSMILVNFSQNIWSKLLFQRHLKFLVSFRSLNTYWMLLLDYLMYGSGG